MVIEKFWSITIKTPGGTRVVHSAYMTLPIAQEWRRKMFGETRLEEIYGIKVENDKILTVGFVQDTVPLRQEMVKV